MRDLIIGFIMMVLSITSMIGFIHDSNYYGLTAEIVSVDYENDIVTVETASGIPYEFKGCDDYFVGDLVSMVMDDKGTDFVTDDKIVSVRYSGYWTDEVDHG